MHAQNADLRLPVYHSQRVTDMAAGFLKDDSWVFGCQQLQLADLQRMLETCASECVNGNVDDEEAFRHSKRHGTGTLRLKQEDGFEQESQRVRQTLCP